MLSEHVSGVLEHKRQVARLLLAIAQELTARAVVHDDSKFSPEELESFELVTPRLKELTYGSEEYKAALREIMPAIQHHYAANSHHPEHFPDGISGMNLVDVVEMTCDWIAATKRVKDGDLLKSMNINEERFGIEKQLAAIIWRTIEHLVEEQGS